MQSSVFLPLQSGFGFIFWAALVAAFIGLALALYLIRLPVDRSTWGRLRPVAAILCFFLFLIMGSTAFFSAWRTQQLEEVVVDGISIQSSYGKTQLNDIRRISLQPDIQRPRFNSLGDSDTTWLLVLETRKGGAQIFSEAEYPILDILKALDEVID